MIKYTQRILTSTIFKSAAINFKFGSGEHHEINRDKIRLSDPKTGYFLDPNDCARRIMRIIALHDKVKDPESMTLNTQWWELGIDQFDYVQIMIGIENDFRIEIADQALQKFKDINDAVEHVSRSFFAV